jgi:hypothetical protein
MKAITVEIDNSISDLETKLPAVDQSYSVNESAYDS